MSFTQIDCYPIELPFGVTNSCLIRSSDAAQVLIVDPVGSPKDWAARLSPRETPLAILLTHGHYDHITAAQLLRETHQIPLYCSILDQDLLRYSVGLLNSMGFPLSLQVDQWIQPGQEALTFGGGTVRLIHTPGHSKGSLCFHLPDAKLLISGDTLFYESVGRTDFPDRAMQGDAAALQESLKKLMQLPPDTRVFPGHGPGTTIGHELQYNSV